MAFRVACGRGGTAHRINLQRLRVQHPADDLPLQVAHVEAFLENVHAHHSPGFHGNADLIESLPPSYSPT